MKHLISRRNFLKAAGVTTAAAAMAVGAPAASACWTGEKSEVTILYTNDVHTYIDKQAPELTYAAIAALKQSYQNAGKKVLLVDDVISTGESLHALEKLTEKAGGNIVGRSAVLAEGDAAERKDIIFLAPLPLLKTEE